MAGRAAGSSVRPDRPCGLDGYRVSVTGRDVASSRPIRARDPHTVGAAGQVHDAGSLARRGCGTSPAGVRHEPSARWRCTRNAQAPALRSGSMSTLSVEPEATDPTVTPPRGSAAHPGSPAAARTARSTRSRPEPNASSRPSGSEVARGRQEDLLDLGPAQGGVRGPHQRRPGGHEGGGDGGPVLTAPAAADLGGDDTLAGSHEVDERPSTRESGGPEAATDARDPEDPRVGSGVDRGAALLATVPRGGDHRDPLLEGVADRVGLGRRSRSGCSATG